jgi:hypothetical protein
MTRSLCEIYLHFLSAAVGILFVVIYMEFRPIPKPNVIVHNEFNFRSDANNFVSNFVRFNSAQYDNNLKVLIISGPNGSGKSKMLNESTKGEHDIIWISVNQGHNFSKSLIQTRCASFNHIVVLTIAANVTKSILYSLNTFKTDLSPQTKLIIILKEHMHLLAFRGNLPPGHQIIWLNHFTREEAHDFVTNALPIIKDNERLISELVYEIGHHVGMLKQFTSNVANLMAIAYTQQSNMNRSIIDSIIYDELDKIKEGASIQLRQFPFFGEYCLFYF